MRVAILTTGRQDWTGLSVVARALAGADDFELVLVAGGMHARGGSIPDEIDGLGVDGKIDVLPADDSAAAVADAAGRTTSAVSKVLPPLRPDALMLLGDRTETLGAAVAATCLGVPVIHLHGGEETEGAIDNACRHAITKLSHVHCVAHASFARRLEQMGEPASRIIVSGAPALDVAMSTPRLPRREIASRVGLRDDGRWIVCTHHPTTLGAVTPAAELAEVLGALGDRVGDFQVVFTRPNVDEGHGPLAAMLDRFAREHVGDVVVVDSLGAPLYFSLLAEAALMVGNSSSGIIEGPLFRLPVVNVGDRQKGRMRGDNVLDVPAERAAIARAIDAASSEATRARLRESACPYGDGRAAPRILDGLRALGPGLGGLSKPFVDLPLPS